MKWWQRALLGIVVAFIVCLVMTIIIIAVSAAYVKFGFFPAVIAGVIMFGAIFGITQNK